MERMAVFLPAARTLRADGLAHVPPDFAAQVRWLDWLTMNPDRGPANPNILVDGSRYWLIDHGAALPFQHDWAAVTEAAPMRRAAPIPASFLRPLVPAPATTDAVERRRSAYAAYLWKRLRGPRPFAAGAAEHAG